MAVKKINARDVFLARIMEERSAAVRRTAEDTIRQAEEHVQRSERIISQSMMIVERAEQLLHEMGRAKRIREPSMELTFKPRSG